jgi:hypothetical protein
MKSSQQKGRQLKWFSFKILAKSSFSFAHWRQVVNRGEKQKSHESFVLLDVLCKRGSIETYSPSKNFK